MKVRCPACGNRGVPAGARFSATPSSPATCGSCGVLVAGAKPFGRTMIVHLVEQGLVFPAVFALFLVSSSPWWLLVVALPFAPRLVFDLTSRLEVISIERQANAQQTDSQLLKVLFVLVAVVLAVGILSNVFG